MNRNAIWGWGNVLGRLKVKIVITDTQIMITRTEFFQFEANIRPKDGKSEILCTVEGTPSISLLLVIVQMVTPFKESCKRSSLINLGA